MNYEGRMKAIEKKLPKKDWGEGAEVEIGNEDGTITTKDGRRLECAYVPEGHSRRKAKRQAELAAAVHGRL